MTVDPGRVLRRRRSPFQFALGGVLVALILVVEVLILQAYVTVNRSTAMFGQVTFLTGNLVNVQREALLLNVEIEELAATHDLCGATLRRGLLGTELLVMEGLGEDAPRVMATVRAIGPDLQLIDRALRAGLPGRPPGRPRLPGRPGLPLRPADAGRGHDRAAGQVPGRRRVPPVNGPAGRIAVGIA